MYDVIVVGGGISGLTAAYHLHRLGKNVLLLESEPAPGGAVMTEVVEGYTLEAGPNSLRTENPETTDLITALGLDERVLRASDAAKHRFIVRNGKLVEAPSSPGTAIGTKLLSISAKLRILREPFIAPSAVADESVAAFATRRVGKEFTDYVISPFVSGIYAGDANQLSVRSAFPMMWDFEREAHSLIKGALAKRKQPKTTPRVKRGIISFQNGLQELIDALGRRLGDIVQIKTKALALSRNNEGYLVSTKSAAWPAREVILASPAHVSAQLIRTLHSGAATALDAIPYPPVSIAYLGYDRSSVTKPVEGFGVLCPPIEGRGILGCIFNSSVFPPRAPSGKMLLSVMIGGASNPGIAAKSDDELLKLAQTELSSLLGLNGTPEFARLRRWQRAIPQYTLGHHDRMTMLDIAEAQLPGLHFLANYRGGISLGSCIRNATDLAKRLVEPRD